MPMLNNCCVCLSLKTGTIISGVLGIATSIIGLIIMLVSTVKVRTIVFADLSPLIVKIILGINLVITVLISILLIIGAVKRKRWFMLPWVVIALIYTIGLVISVIYTSVEFFLNNQVIYGTVSLIFGLIIAALHVYLWLVVFSYYQLVREEKNRGPHRRINAHIS